MPARLPRAHRTGDVAVRRRHDVHHHRHGRRGFRRPDRAGILRVTRPAGPSAVVSEGHHHAGRRARRHLSAVRHFRPRGEPERAVRSRRDDLLVHQRRRAGAPKADAAGYVFASGSHMLSGPRSAARQLRLRQRHGEFHRGAAIRDQPGGTGRRDVHALQRHQQRHDARRDVRAAGVDRRLDADDLHGRRAADGDYLSRRLPMALRPDASGQLRDRRRQRARRHPFPVLRVGIAGGSRVFLRGNSGGGDRAASLIGLPTPSTRTRLAPICGHVAWCLDRRPADADHLRDRDVPGAGRVRLAGPRDGPAGCRWRPARPAARRALRRHAADHGLSGDLAVQIGAPGQLDIFGLQVP